MMRHSTFIAPLNYPLNYTNHSASYRVTPDPSNITADWQGWGTSLCWWAKAFGDRADADAIADAIFSLKSSVTLSLAKGSVEVPGLGLNIARYNAGASSDEPAGGDMMQRSPHVSDTRLVDAFWLTWEGQPPSGINASGTWDMTRDANQRTMMLKAKARGVDRLQLFSNSPVWWQLDNHNPSGANSGANDNLQSWNYRQHAVYMAAVAQYAKTHWNVTFDSVEPLNEPISDWWSASGTQEGCHFEHTTQADAVLRLREELDARGLQGVRVAASDENTYDEAIASWNALGPAAQGSVEHICVHGYQQGGGRRDVLYTLARDAGKRLWNSEYGDGDGSGLPLASNLNLDFLWLHPQAWVYWQVLDGGGWGLLDASNEERVIHGVNRKFHVLAQYTRHIRPGFGILGSSDGNTVAAYSAAHHRLVLVTTNYDTSRSIQFDLSAFKRVPDGPVLRWVTQTTKSGAGDAYVRYNDTAVKGAVFAAAFEAGMLQTFEIENVER